ncbi:MAG: DNA polymerase III subunit delta [Saprospiraceae bacterium]|nr:DNA polymerase III subunit delta [Saprospiraceae bacterium]
MSFEDILRDIRAKRFHPVYFLHGEEPFFIDRIAEAIEDHALPEAERGFNQTVLYGKDTEPMPLLDTLRRYPMMAERQVVVLREAQDMKGIADLASYLEKPMASTLFVLCYKHKKLDMRTKFGKALMEKALVFESKKLYDNQVADWIAGYCKSKKLGIEHAASALMAEYLGTDLSKIANEVDKLALNLPAGSTVSEANVQEYIGISKEYNTFELQKAMAGRDVAKMARMVHYFAENIKKNPLIPTIASLYGFFSKVYTLHFYVGKTDAEQVKALELRSEWFLKDYKLALRHYSQAQCEHILGLLHEYDLYSKGVDGGQPEEELLKEMIWKMLHTA